MGKWIIIIKKNKHAQMLTYQKDNLIKPYRNHNGLRKIIRISKEINGIHTNTATNGVPMYAAALTNRFKSTISNDTPKDTSRTRKIAT